MRFVHILGLGLVVGMVALGAVLSAVAFRWQEAVYPGEPAVEAPPVRLPLSAAVPPEVAQGQALFQQRCSTCHTIGGGRRVGPDLKNVTTNRAHDWLVEMIANPDELIARSDPIIVQLLPQYGTPMPDTGTSKIEAESILAYIAAESGEGAASPKAAPGSPEPGGPAAARPAPGSLAAAPETVAPLLEAAQVHRPPVSSRGRAPAQAGQQAGNVAQGQSLYQAKCAGCHSIGGGRLAGPDLKGIAQQRPRDWLIEFIVDPGDVIARGDPTATQLVQEYGGLPMPDLGVTRPQAEDILAYIEAESGGAAAPPGGAAPAPLPQGDPEAGRALFIGERPFKGGGPACIACHSAGGVGALGGGTWAKDLTDSVARLGPQGVAAMVKTPAFPAMDAAYPPDAFTDQQVADLVAFLSTAQQPAGTNQGLLFSLFGLVVLVVLVGGSHLVWQGRARGPREPRIRR